MGQVKSHRAGDTGIGKTLEDLLDIKENNIQAPDLHGFEIKSMRQMTSSNLTLFTKSPNPTGSNNRLRESYGSEDETFPKLRVLHTTLKNNWNTHTKGKVNYSYCLELDNKLKRINFLVKKLDEEEILENGEVSNDCFLVYL